MRSESARPEIFLAETSNKLKTTINSLTSCKSKRLKLKKKDQWSIKESNRCKNPVAAMIRNRIHPRTRPIRKSWSTLKTVTIIKLAQEMDVQSSSSNHSNPAKRCLHSKMSKSRMTTRRSTISSRTNKSLRQRSQTTMLRASQKSQRMTSISKRTRWPKRLIFNHQSNPM